MELCNHGCLETRVPAVAALLDAKPLYLKNNGHGKGDETYPSQISGSLSSLSSLSVLSVSHRVHMPCGIPSLDSCHMGCTVRD